MGLSIQDKVALVTGGARGIGAGIVGCLAAAGAKVMIADIGVAAEPADNWRYALADEDDLKKTLALGEHISATHVDVTEPDSCAAAVAACVAEFGRIDMLVNNAGVVDSGPLEHFDPEAWDRIFAVNSKGIFLMSQAALPWLRKADNPCIVNTASIAGKKGYPNMSAYCGSKFAAIGITQSLAAELAGENIRVNAICPGMVGTAMWLDHLLPTNATTSEQRNEEFETSMRQTIPLGRPQTAQDMGDAVLYLVTAANVSGIALAVAGGFEMN
jgi:meso-butanediol dehydrogenase / (S,S)-butanediol dehydrogenase / diacetyl reductase